MSQAKIKAIGKEIGSGYVNIESTSPDDIATRVLMVAEADGMTDFVSDARLARA